jgi:DNA repair protein RadC
MNIETPRKSIRFKIIKPVYSTLIISEEELPEYLCRTRRFNCANDVFQMFRSLVDTPRESFICLHLDNKNKILCIDNVSTGSLTASIVHPREVFTSAILSAAAGLIFVHAHPSGDPEPSREDLDITTRLKQCSELLGIRVLDHIIIGENRYVSLADRGLI